MSEPRVNRLRWRRCAALLAIAALGLPAVGCGKKKESDEQKQYRTQATTRCSDALTPVSQAADFTSPGAPHEAQLTRAAVRLRIAAAQLEGLRAPRQEVSKRSRILALQRRAASLIDHYVKGEAADTLGNNALDSVSIVLINLENAAAKAKLPACALNVDE